MHRIANCIAPGWRILHNYSDASNGRIWLIWDQNYYDLQKLKTFAQLVHRLVQNRRKGHQFLITVIYGFNTMELRRTLWDELKHIAPGVNQPWLIAGDFNALLSPRDSFYKSLMGSAAATLPAVDYHIMKLGPTLTRSQRMSLCTDVFDEEIAPGLNAIWKKKTPGVDGYNGHFFKL
ncbi:putative glutathione S-transferase U10-like [Capsicum annuum]|nr:putative glutathione S-transferase U10-like [Capsicum annuum]